RTAHDLVVVRMELDHIDAMAETIVAAQSRTVAMGVEAQRIQRVAGQRAIRRDLRGPCLPSLAPPRLAQPDIGAPQIARRELGGLVLYEMILDPVALKPTCGRRHERGHPRLLSVVCFDSRRFANRHIVRACDALIAADHRSAKAPP